MDRRAPRLRRSVLALAAVGLALGTAGALFTGVTDLHLAREESVSPAPGHGTWQLTLDDENDEGRLRLDAGSLGSERVTVGCVELRHRGAEPLALRLHGDIDPSAVADRVTIGVAEAADGPCRSNRPEVPGATDAFVGSLADLGADHGDIASAVVLHPSADRGRPFAVPITVTFGAATTDRNRPRTAAGVPAADHWLVFSAG